MSSSQVRLRQLGSTLMILLPICADPQLNSLGDKD